MRRRHNLASPPTYDQRFVSLFLNELELRGFPCYPQISWFTALRRADHEFAALRPLKELRPQLCATETYRATGVPEGSAKQLTAYNFGSRTNLEWLSALVNTACSRFLVARGLHENTVWATS
jgi:hypothetical protein